MNPSGVRIGTPAITSRGYLEQDSREVARLLDEAIKVGLDLQKSKNTHQNDKTLHIFGNNLMTVKQ